MNEAQSQLYRSSFISSFPRPNCFLCAFLFQDSPAMYEWQLSTRLRLLRPSLLLMGIPFACAPAIQSTGMEPVVAERLYFGRNIADTLGVSDSAWTVFVADIVSARLPRGFTFWKAEGQWRGVAGRPKREPSFVLEVVHPAGSAETDSAILAIIAEYKRRFGQEAVLRVATDGRASF